MTIVVLEKSSAPSLPINFSDPPLPLPGLVVELYADQLSYMKGGLSEKAGARLVVHDSDAFPMVDEFGLDLQPGTATAVALQMESQ